MKCAIVIPCHNEAHFIGKTLASLISQTRLPNTIVVVDDQSTDDSAQIITSYTETYDYIKLIQITSSDEHLPGSKVIQAFQKGFATLNQDFDIICKFDADLIFPDNYLERIVAIFTENPQVGMAGGFCYIEKEHDWVLENLTNKLSLIHI